jgi:hypothetical protein
MQAGKFGVSLLQNQPKVILTSHRLKCFVKNAFLLASLQIFNALKFRLTLWQALQWRLLCGLIQTGVKTMAKLIAAFKADKSQKNRDKLQKYVAKHPMAACMVDPADIAELQAAGIKL